MAFRVAFCARESELALYSATRCFRALVGYRRALDADAARLLATDEERARFAAGLALLRPPLPRFCARAAPAPAARPPSADVPRLADRLDDTGSTAETCTLSSPAPPRARLEALVVLALREDIATRCRRRTCLASPQ